MADSNRQEVYYFKKSAYGDTLNNTAFKAFRYTRDGLQFQPTHIESQELRSDRMIDDDIRVSSRSAGNIDAEFSADSFDDTLVALMHQSDWTAAVTATGTVYSMASGDNSFNRSSGSFISDGLSATDDVGKWISFSGFTGDTTNNTRFKIVSVAATKIVLSHGTVVTDAAGESVTWARGKYLTVGTTRNHFALVRLYNDLGSAGTEPAAVYDDATPVSGNLTIQAGAIFGFATQWLAREEQSLTKATASAGTPTYAVSDGDGNAVVSSVDGISRIFIAGSDFPIYSLNLGMANAIQEKPVVGPEGIDGYISGSFSVSVEAAAYLSAANIAEYAKFLADTTSTLALEVTGSGHYYIWDLPKSKYRTGSKNGEGKDSQTYLRLSASGLRDPSEGTSLTITKF